jgi:AAA domain
VTTLEHIQQMEMAVIGAVIEQPDRYAEAVFGSLQVEQFGGRLYQVASTVYEMVTDRAPITPQLVLERMRTKGVLRSEHGVMVADCCAFGYATPSVESYVDALADLYLARRIHILGTRAQVMAKESDVHSTLTYLSREIAEMAETAGARIVDETMTLTDILSMPDEDITWLVPNLIPASDRILITADEGAGKSTLLRQLALAYALGVDPFEPANTIEPGKALLIDCEVSSQQLSKALRQMHSFGSRHTHSGKPDNLLVESRQGGVDLCDPADQAWLLRLVRQHQPKIIALGPLYRMATGDINDESTVRCWQRLMEPLLEQGISIVMEHHAPNAHDGGGNRMLRPIGSSVIRRWFAQGIALRSEPCAGHDRLFCRLCPRRGKIELWRGSRDETWWPDKLRSPMKDIWWLGADDN